MERISYKNFKNDEAYFCERMNSYSNTDKTITVYNRSVVEFDYNILKNYEPIHLRYINVVDEEDNENGNLRVAFHNTRIKYPHGIGYYEDMFEEVYKDYFDRFFETVDLTDEQKEEVISNIKRKVCIINSLKHVKKKMENGLISNFVEYKLDSNISVSRGELNEPEIEKPKKIITMRYTDYKKTDFSSVKDSYNKDEKTIDVYVPVDYEYSLERKVITMNYKDSKKYSFQTVDGTFDKKYNTIDVYVPLNFEYELPKTKIIKMYYDDFQKCNFRKIPDSYDSKEHTFDVCVPEDYEYELPEFHVVTVLYKDYKKKYKNKYRVCGSYNDKKGTIDMLFPVGVEYIKDEKDEHYEKIHAFRKGYTNEVTIEPKILNPDDIEVEVPECLKN